jgi:hypothetical protein
VHQAGAVRRRQPAPAGEEHVDDLAPTVPTGVHPRPQRAALDQLHGDVRRLACLAHLVHGDDVGVRQAGHGHGLALEPLLTEGGDGVVPAARSHDLERDRAIELRVVGAQHHAHAAAPEQAE